MQQLLLKYAKQYWLPALVLLYLIGFGYILGYKRSWFYPYCCVPVALFIVYTALFHLQNLVFFLAFCTPLAITLKEMGLTQGPDLSIPTEPVMAGIMLMYILNALNAGINDKGFLRHFVTRLIMFQLLWMFITTLTSTELIISLKYLISRLWFIFSCYLIIPFLFKDKKNIVRFIFSYGFALAIVVAYTTARHAQFTFNDKAADWVVSPFYNDHTAYGAALAMFIPVLVSFLFVKSISPWQKIMAFSLFLVFTLAIILSFARAGWLSLAIVFCILITLILKIRFQTLVITFTSLILLFFAFQTEILMVLGRNSTDAEGSFENNIASVYNISTDASNLERINRWSCAVRMWMDKPFFGWGPGTYMFKYAPYQLSHQLTIISTNFGTNGNAHSEYLGPLAEQGVIGLLIVLVLLFYVTAMGYRLVYSLQGRDERILCTGLFLGIMTYFVHGFFNNFLDTDKLALPFYAFLAGLVTFDMLYGKKRPAQQTE